MQLSDSVISELPLTFDLCLAKHWALHLERSAAMTTAGFRVYLNKDISVHREVQSLNLSSDCNKRENLLGGLYRRQQAALPLLQYRVRESLFR